MWSYAALWTSMAACIPTYMLASSLIAAGMNWWQAVLTVFLGNVIVLIPMMLNAHAGTKYGIPFPVYCRASFGTLGAIADYFVIRRCKLDTADLYRAEGIYRYHSGFSYAGIAAFLLAALPCLPGFLVQIGVLANTHPTFTAIYQQAWFIGFGLAFVLYLLFRKLSPAVVKI